MWSDPLENLSLDDQNALYEPEDNSFIHVTSSGGRIGRVAYSNAMKQNATMDRQQPTPPAELIISHEPEFPGQVVWQQGRTLGIAPDEATAQAAAAAMCREEE